MEQTKDYPRPDPRKMYGVLHNEDGTPIRRQVRSLKVGIGVPSGKDIHVWIDAAGKWCIETGSMRDAKRESVVARFDTKEQARAKYGELHRSAMERKYPRKIPYFTFLRQGIEGFTHDFDAIEEHGPLPTEINIILIEEQPFDSAFQAWTARELKCEGDGINARRRLDWAKTPREKELAEEAKQRGERFFPIVEGCFSRGCPFPHGEKPACKPNGRLRYQLINSPRVGSTCTFDTTGYRSISQIGSCLLDIRSMTSPADPDSGYVSGIPLTMVLRPYTVAPQGKAPTTQYAVSLEFRAKDAVSLMTTLKQHAAEFRAAAMLVPAPLQLTAGSPNIPHYIDDDEVSDAAAMAAEFYVDGDSSLPEDAIEDEIDPKTNPFSVGGKATTAPSAPATSTPPPAAEKKSEPAPTPAPAQARRGGRKKDTPAPPTPPAEEKGSGFQATDNDLPENLGGTSKSPVTQAERFVAIDSAIAKKGNVAVENARKQVRIFVKAFVGPDVELLQPPQDDYEPILGFLESIAKDDSAAKSLLAGAADMGKACGEGWRDLLHWTESASPEFADVAKRVAYARYYDDGGSGLVDFIEQVVEKDGEIPDSECAAFLHAYLACKPKTSTALQLLELCRQRDTTIVEALAPFAEEGLNKLTEKNVLEALTGTPKSSVPWTE